MHYTFCLIDGKTCGSIFPVQREFRDPSAAAWVQEMRAEAKLADMDLVEDLAVLAETEACPRIGRDLRDRYRSLVGVYPELRYELRSAMKRIAEGGGMPVQDTVDLINRDLGTTGPTQRAGRVAASAGILTTLA